MSFLHIAYSIEKLVLNLSVFCFSEDPEIADSIKELMRCYKNIDLLSQVIEVKTGKKGSTDVESEKQKSEAMEVYVDFLVELLTRPYLFVREVANFCFQQIAKEISPASIQNLLNIVKTPNSKASAMIGISERGDEPEVGKEASEEESNEVSVEESNEASEEELMSDS